MTSFIGGKFLNGECQLFHSMSAMSSNRLSTSQFHVKRVRDGKIIVRLMKLASCNIFSQVILEGLDFQARESAL